MYICICICCIRVYVYVDVYVYIYVYVYVSVYEYVYVYTYAYVYIYMYIYMYMYMWLSCHHARQNSRAQINIEASTLRTRWPSTEFMVHVACWDSSRMWSMAPIGCSFGP